MSVGILWFLLIVSSLLFVGSLRLINGPRGPWSFDADFVGMTGLVFGALAFAGSLAALLYAA